MKNFKEFLKETYLVEKTTSTKEEGEKYHDENPPFDGEPYRLKNKARAGEPPQWRPIRAKKRAEQEKRRRDRMKSTTDARTKVKKKVGQRERFSLTPYNSITFFSKKC